MLSNPAMSWHGSKRDEKILGPWIEFVNEDVSMIVGIRSPTRAL